MLDRKFKNILRRSKCEKSFWFIHIDTNTESQCTLSCKLLSPLPLYKTPDYNIRTVVDISHSIKLRPQLFFIDISVCSPYFKLNITICNCCLNFVQIKISLCLVLRNRINRWIDDLSAIWSRNLQTHPFSQNSIS